MTFEKSWEFYRELTASDLERLNKSTHLLGDFGYWSPGEAKYISYRRRGFARTDALAYAIAWCTNAVEQYERRLGHDTGAEGWRAI